MEFHEYANIFPMLDAGGLEALRADIEKNGLLEPIVTYEEKVLEGRNRFTACMMLDIKPKTIEYTGDDPLAYVISKNLIRRHLNESQRAMAAAKIANMPPHRPKNKSANLPTYVSQSDAAEKLNVGERSVRSAKKVLNDGVSELVEAVEQGKVTVSDAEKIAKLPKEQQKQAVAEGKSAKQIENQVTIATLQQREVVMPDGTFHCIAIDPPWAYGTSYDSGGRRVANPYPEMTQEQLKALDIRAKDDCVLFLWTTHRFIWDAKELLDCWGFEYRSILVWDKEKMGMGDLFRMQCEFCLIGIKGKPILNNPKNIRDIIREARREHSRKPEAFYEIVETLCPYKKMEYFAREQREGYEVYGNDTEKF